MTDPTIQSVLRSERAARRADATGPCDLCGSRVAVKGQSDGVRCYEHRRGPEAIVELDHVAGVGNLGLTLSLRGNAHREVERIRLALGMDTWPDGDPDPLVRLAHLLGGLATILWLAAQWLVDVAL